MTSKRFEMISQRFEMTSKRFEMISQRFEMTSKRFEMISQRLEMTSRTQRIARDCGVMTTGADFPGRGLSGERASERASERGARFVREPRGTFVGDGGRK
jgi:hypothetical protein